MHVYDGSDVFGTELGKLHGNAIPAAVESTGRDMFLNFLSDYSTTETGFQLTFEAGKNK